MEIRGERECAACGTRWSYYETGSVECPACGSLRSTGVGDRAEHTASPVEFDLTPLRSAVDADPLEEVGERAAERAAEYVRRAGFVDAGELRPLADTYLVAAELRRVGSYVARTLRLAEPEEAYFLRLLRGDTDGRPPAAEVPESLAPERALAVTASVDAYLGDLRRVLEEPEPPVTRVLSALDSRRKRVEALDGEVELDEAERLVRAVADLHAYLGEGEEAALARAQERF
jgi:uncharacterized Zn finger protein (UPF0148 family)